MKCDYNKLIEENPMLKNYSDELGERCQNFEETYNEIIEAKTTLLNFASGYSYYGFHKQNSGWYFREWAPAAKEIYIFGDFNNWEKETHKLTKLTNGNWEIFIPNNANLHHKSFVRLFIKTDNEAFERVPSYSKYITTNPLDNKPTAQIWLPDEEYKWENLNFIPEKENLMIYECHIGISGEKEKSSTFNEFTINVLPRVKNLGYNAIQLMAIKEHNDYTSSGYKVANFFAPSSRFGTPDDLKNLIDTAHTMGIAVIMDIVHSQADSCEKTGLARFDSTAGQYFHEPPRGIHPIEKTCLFNYGKKEVISFLLSNIRYWLEEFKFDGLCFHGVTSMMYRNHGINEVFKGYKQYFSKNTDNKAITYLQLATTLSRQINNKCILIADEKTDMPGLCSSVEYGGIGFGYKLATNVPIYWNSFTDAFFEDSYSISNMWSEIANSCSVANNIGYCECSKNYINNGERLMHRLLKHEINSKKGKNTIDFNFKKTVALHKMIRLITCAASGNSYKNFIGTEIGHPEYINLPFTSNNYNYKSVDKPISYHKALETFDKEMINIAKFSDSDSKPTLYFLDEDAKIIVFKKGVYILMFNFHSNNSYIYELPKKENRLWNPVIYSDWKKFGGNLSNGLSTSWIDSNSTQTIYLESLSAAVYETEIKHNKELRKEPLSQIENEIFLNMHSENINKI